MEITQEQKTTYANINGQFVAVSDGTTIYQLSPFGFGQQQKVAIGVTQQTYDELKAITDGYYQKLVELGVIIPPKSEEEKQAEQQQLMSEMFAMIKDLKGEIEVLKNDKHYSKNDEPKSSTSFTSLEYSAEDGRRSQD